MPSEAVEKSPFHATGCGRPSAASRSRGRRFDDRAADGQTDTYAIALGRIEGVEKLTELGGAPPSCRARRIVGVMRTQHRRVAAWPKDYATFGEASLRRIGRKATLVRSIVEMAERGVRVFRPLQASAAGFLERGVTELQPRLSPPSGPRPRSPWPTWRFPRRCVLRIRPMSTASGRRPIRKIAP